MRGVLGLGIACALAYVLAACGDDRAPGLPSEGIGGATCDPETPAYCEDGVLLRCLDGGVEQRTDCGTQGLTCDPDLGCVACVPYQYGCDGDQRTRCDAEGKAVEVVETCADGTQCSAEGCRDLCADALAERSYLGCEYWPTFTSNSQLDDVFLPAVVIANPNLVDATVRIEKAGAEALEEVVPPRSSKSVYLAFDRALKGSYDAPGGSVLVPGGAYHLRSSVPVTVHQFNPLLYQIDEDCLVDPQDLRGDDRCNSYTNDASLLLPAHVLSRAEGEGVSYFGIARATFFSRAQSGAARSDFPGFLAITGAGPEPVQVRVKSSAHTVASGDGLIAALAPGDELVQMLAPGDVLELRSASPETCTGESAIISPRAGADYVVCDPGAAYDLTGTEIEADGAVQVIGGHDCTYVPFDQPACDHLEESLYPVETWGKDVLVSRPRARGGVTYQLRVISAEAGNRVTFEPPLVEPFTLGRGEFHDIQLSDHVIVHGTKALAVAQFLEGQGGTSDSGDPSMSMAIPLDQFRSEYYFLSPDTYQADYLNVIAPTQAEVLLDGVRVTGWEELEDTGYRVAPVTLFESGQHVLESEQGDAIGLVLYGFGEYTSYMMPGGLDLRIIGNPL